MAIQSGLLIALQLEEWRDKYTVHMTSVYVLK